MEGYIKNNFRCGKPIELKRQPMNLNVENNFTGTESLSSSFTPTGKTVLNIKFNYIYKKKDSLIELYV